MSMPQKCIELFGEGFEATLSLPERKQRTDAVKKLVIESKDGFQEGCFAEPEAISFVDELIVVVLFLIIMGGPLAVVVSFLVLLVFGSWMQLCVHVAITLALAFHPVPKAHP